MQLPAEMFGYSTKAREDDCNPCIRSMVFGVVCSSQSLHRSAGGNR